MQKDADNDRMMSNNGGRIGDTCDLSQLALLLALRSKRESFFDLEAMTKFLQLSNMSLSDVLDIRDALVGEINYRVAVLKDARVVVRAALRHIHKEMRDEPPGHTKVVKYLKVTKGGDIYLDLAFRNPSRRLLLFTPSQIFLPCIPHILCRFSFLFNFTPEVKDMRSTIKDVCSSHSYRLSYCRHLIDKRDMIILRAESNLTTIGLYVNHLK